RLDAAGRVQLALAEHHAARRLRHGLETGAAEAVHGHARHADGEAGQQRAHARDVPVVLAGLVRAAQVDVGHVALGDARPLGHRPQREGREVVGPHRRERAAVAADRRAHGRHDHGLPHARHVFLPNRSGSPSVPAASRLSSHGCGANRASSVPSARDRSAVVTSLEPNASPHSSGPAGYPTPRRIARSSSRLVARPSSRALTASSKRRPTTLNATPPGTSGTVTTPTPAAASRPRARASAGVGASPGSAPAAHSSRASTPPPGGGTQPKPRVAPAAAALRPQVRTATRSLPGAGATRSQPGAAESRRASSTGSAAPSSAGSGRAARRERATALSPLTAKAGGEEATPAAGSTPGEAEGPPPAAAAPVSSSAAAAIRCPDAS